MSDDPSDNTLARKASRFQASAILAKARKQRVIELVCAGSTIAEALAHPDVNCSMSAYKQWRLRDKHFCAEMDLARARALGEDIEYQGNHASFAMRYFGMAYAPFQLMWAEMIDRLPPGNILMSLWPPEHGKTTTFENYATEKLATHPDTRMTVVSENKAIARKIIGRVKHRLEPDGPFPDFIREWGPFKPPSGQGRDKQMSQPWGADFFNVYKKGTHDERDYSMMALGFKSSIVSTRTDHLHADDLQSVKTAGQTDQLEEFFRQDALSRPGEYGRTTMAGTRVSDDDVYSRLADDDDLDGILHVIRFKAIITDPITGEQQPLWPERYSLDQLDRQRRKVGQEAWDRNYMQDPGVSNTNRTFTDEMIERVLVPTISLNDPIPTGAIVYVGLDPALGSMNCVIACEVTADGKMIIRRIEETTGLQRNEQIMQSLNNVVMACNQGGRVTDVVIESKNFQAGLARDERLIEMSQHYGFAMREHLTGWNKYDENIGVASMCESFLRKEIIIPWAADDRTRHEMGELVRQLKAWKPGKRGSKLRQDRVMALWFVWILWRQRYKNRPDNHGNTDGWKRQGVPWKGTRTGLIVPVGVRV